MSVEDRLREALHAEAGRDDAAVDDEVWAEVQRRVRRQRSVRTVRRSVLAAAAGIVTVVAAGLLLTGGDDGSVEVVPADTTTSAPTTTTSVDDSAGSTTTLVPSATNEVFAGIWPFASADAVEAYEADPGIGMFYDAEATALEFAREYLGMPAPVASSDLLVSVDGETASIAVKPRERAPMVTRIHVRRFGAEGPWSVTGADTDDVRVDTPAPGHVLGTTFAVAGTSTAYEATVLVEVRGDSGATLLQTFVMGGANGELAPFSDDLTMDTPTDAAGALIFTTESAEDGTLQEATVVRVGFAAGQSAFSVFFHRGDELVEVPRTGPASAGVLRQALEALFRGPQPGDGDGLSSLFSEDTADVLGDLNLRDGLAIVDLAETVNNASTSAGSEAFLAELHATVLQFGTVDRIEYRLQGSCDGFWSWLQYGDCLVVERDDVASQPAYPR